MNPTPSEDRPDSAHLKSVPHLEKQSIARQLEIAELDLDNYKKIVGERLKIRKQIMAGTASPDELTMNPSVLNEGLTQAWKDKLRMAFRKVYQLRAAQ